MKKIVEHVLLLNLKIYSLENIAFFIYNKNILLTVLIVRYDRLSEHICSRNGSPILPNREDEIPLVVLREQRRTSTDWLIMKIVTPTNELITLTN